MDAAAERIAAGLRGPQLGLAPELADAYAVTLSALVAVIGELNRQIAVLDEAVGAHFGRHPDAQILLSQPGLGTILGARVLAEFGDAPGRYADAKARRNYGGTSPITKASGTKRVVLARYACNRRLADALYRPGVRRPDRLTRGPRALRPAPGRRRHPPPGPARPGQPARRCPARRKVQDEDHDRDGDQVGRDEGEDGHGVSPGCSIRIRTSPMRPFEAGRNL